MKNLKMLLKKMDPELKRQIYVFCTLSQAQFKNVREEAILSFKEREGITIIVEKSIADQNSFTYKGLWNCITLRVHSDLSSVGLLANVTGKLAKAHIPVNVVSAYHHDHLFVPKKYASKAMLILKEISKSD